MRYWHAPAAYGRLCEGVLRGAEQRNKSHFLEKPLQKHWNIPLNESCGIKNGKQRMGKKAKNNVYAKDWLKGYQW